MKKYYAENADKIKEQQKEYRDKNVDKIKEQKKEYRDKNVDKIKEQQRVWCADNIDKKKNSRGYIMLKILINLKNIVLKTMIKLYWRHRINW